MNRGTRAIIKSFFANRRHLGQKVPIAIFWTSVMFIIAVTCVFISWVTWWFPYEIFSDEVYNIVVVNPPDSFIEYNEYTQPYRDAKAKNFGSLDDYRNNWRNITFFEYNYDGYGASKFIYKKTDALYDFVTFGKWMRENDAYLTVVFPADFEEQTASGDSDADGTDVLTYYRTNSNEYTAMKDDFINIYLQGYQNYIRESRGITTADSVESETTYEALSLSDGDNSDNSFIGIMAKGFVPLIIFIAILYSAMSAGTNVIAGQKENGTFTGILMTPVSRRSIVIGNATGVTLKALIPSLTIAAAALCIPYFTSISGIIMTMLFIASLSLLIASITIVISVINDTVVSAQTAFLPVFLILVAVCVTCIQNYSGDTGIYLYMPVYGQFYGIGNALTKEINIPQAVCCILSTSALSAAMLRISESLLSRERFTVSIDSAAKEIKRAATGGKPSIIERIDKTYGKVSVLIDQLFYPLIVLSVFQLLAVVPVIVSYMRKAEYSQFISNLRNVSSVTEIMSKAFEVIGIFMSNPLFLSLMSVGYALIILTYAFRAYRRAKTISFRQAFSRLGLPLDRPSESLAGYLKGAVLGLCMMGSVYLILMLSGQIRFTGFGVKDSLLGTFAVNLIMWIPQGASEEVMFRGFMIPQISTQYKRGVAVFLSSLLFALFHSLNAGFSPLAAINLFIIALLFALIYIKTGNIWMTCAVHTVWNLAQGNLFGLEVSGTDSGASLLHTSYISGAKAIATGGQFGPEGGLAVTFVVLVALAAVTVSLVRSGRAVTG